MTEGSTSTWPVVERGEGRAIVFLHGYPLTHAMWAPQLRSLSARHHVVLLDLPGYGLAEDSPVPDSLGGFAESVYRTLADRFSSPLVIVGHSFGGYVALELFRRHPGRFAALVLADTRSEPDSEEARAKRLDTIRRLGDPAQRLDVDGTLKGLLAPGTLEDNGRVPGIVRGMIRSVPSPTLINSLKAIAGRPDLTPVLSTVNVPSLVVWGEEDRLIPPAQTRTMVGRLRASSGVGIPAAGHLPSLEAPAAFNQVVGAFLDRLSSA